eukprot:4261793-Pleurochrysis_carterae.AAC.1
METPTPSVSASAACASRSLAVLLRSRSLVASSRARCSAASVPSSGGVWSPRRGCVKACPHATRAQRRDAQPQDEMCPKWAAGEGGNAGRE